MTKQAKHMRTINGRNNGSASNKGRIVAIALAGVLALGGVGVGALALMHSNQSPGQSATTMTANPAQKKDESTKQAATQKPEKAEPAKQAEPAQSQTQQAKQAEPAKQTQQAAPSQEQAQPAKQAEQKQDNQAGNSGLEANYTRKQCIEAACNYVGAGGQAKGPALNVTTSGPITGGGTTYYSVELDLGDVHYKVMVDAVDGNVISADSSHNGTTQIVEQGGETVEGTEVQTEA